MTLPMPAFYAIAFVVLAAVWDITRVAKAILIEKATRR